MGATVAGIDAAAELDRHRAATAPRRPTSASARCSSCRGPTQSFDAAVSVNGIWGGCEARARRGVPRAAARRPDRHQLLGQRAARSTSATCFKVFAAPRAAASTSARCGSSTTSASPGVAEAMLDASGFEVVERGERDLGDRVARRRDRVAGHRRASARRSPRSTHGDVDAIKRDVLAALESCRDDRGIYRFRNDHQFVIARKP